MRGADGGERKGERSVRARRADGAGGEAGEWPLQRGHGIAGDRERPVELGLPRERRGRDGDLHGQARRGERTMRERGRRHLHVGPNEQPVQRGHGLGGGGERPVGLDLRGKFRGHDGAMRGKPALGERGVRERERGWGGDAADS
jgi:hypothetical protein